MVKRRAVDPKDKAPSPAKLPLMYQTLVPLVPERHAALRLATKRNYQFSATSSAIPITVDEMPTAMRHYPIVFAPGEVATPVALVGFERGINAMIDHDGNWKDGAYVPAYVRRYPFGLVQEEAGSDRRILCADMSSVLLSEGGEGQEMFTKDGKPAEAAERAMDFCQRYHVSMQRTRAVMKEAADLGVLGPSEVTISSGDVKRKVDGFAIISEEKLRALDDKTLAGLARRGVLTLYGAHQMSLANFSDLGR